jgi:hypothetical protein
MTTPDNAGYFHAAYVAAVLIWTLYAASIWWRFRRLSAQPPDASPSPSPSPDG